jgi:hypothetical protein
MRTLLLAVASIANVRADPTSGKYAQFVVAFGV